MGGSSEIFCPRAVNASNGNARPDQSGVDAFTDCVDDPDSFGAADRTGKVWFIPIISPDDP